MQYQISHLNFFYLPDVRRKNVVITFSVKLIQGWVNDWNKEKDKHQEFYINDHKIQLLIKKICNFQELIVPGFFGTNYWEREIF